MEKKKLTGARSKRPEGMPRELYSLLCSDNKDHPVFTTGNEQGYKPNKAKLGSKRVRPWKWMPFTNPARQDGAVFHHWRPIEDEAEEYPFAKLNKVVPVPEYTDDEYVQHLQEEGWTREETDHLFDLCQRFNLRFIVIQDRWDCTRFPKRSVEDIKERYYNICNTLTKIRAIGRKKPKLIKYDADHERRRKEQEIKLYNRTREQVEEEQTLMNELRKIELRKKEKEKKTLDLQKLLTAADSNQSKIKCLKERGPKKKVIQEKNIEAENTILAVGTTEPKLITYDADHERREEQLINLYGSTPEQVVSVLEYTDDEYVQHLQKEDWTRQETDHLFDLCQRFHLRFIVIQDRWDCTRFPKRSVEDIKERYYNICNTLTKIRPVGTTEPKLISYDADHKRRRKPNLIRLCVEEEQTVLNEIPKIELREKEIEKKTQDFQKLITAADSNHGETNVLEKKGQNEQVFQQKNIAAENTNVDSSGIKFPDCCPRVAGVYIRSHMMKLPASVEQKKVKAIEQRLEEIDIEPDPVPTASTCYHFNELRCYMSQIYDLKLALADCEKDTPDAASSTIMSLSEGYDDDVILLSESSTSSSDCENDDDDDEN